jgi:hypothetical protein
MRAHEFINEAAVGKLHKDQAAAMPGVHRTRDVGGYDRVYHMNRMWMAMAKADGKSTKKPEGMDGAAWSEKYNTIHPYTKEEHNMVKQAMKVVPTDHKNVVSDHRSLESDDTHKVSPVTGFRGYGK